MRASPDGHSGRPVRWTERVQVVRSQALAQRQEATLEQHLVAAEAALQTVTPTLARGKRQVRDEASLQAAIATVLERYDVAGLLTARWERHETMGTHDVGRGRGGPHRPTHTTERPTGKRLSKAFARAKLSLTHIHMGTAIAWRLTPLSPLHVQLLYYLHLPVSLDTALVDTS